jgi:hypothetical protein
MKMKFTPLTTLIGALLLFMANLSMAQSSAVLDAELNRFKKDIASENSDALFAAQRLKLTGISDAALFDAIAERLKNNYMSERKSDLELNYWLVRSLAFSGQEKYAEVCTQIFHSEAPKRLRQHAKLSLLEFPQYKIANPVIAANNQKATSQEELNKIRLLNMINDSGDFLPREGASRIFDQFRNDLTVVTAVNNVLLSTYKNAPSNERVGALNWMVRIIGESGFKEFKPTLEQVANDPLTHKKLKKYAVKFSAYL